MNARVSGFLERHGRSHHVGLGSAAERRHRDRPALLSDGFDSREITVRGDGESRFDDIRTQRFELSGHAHLLSQIHRTSR